LGNLSKNKMAKEVNKIVLDDFKTIISTDTIIRYLDQENFKFYPWKKKNI